MTFVSTFALTLLLHCYYHGNADSEFSYYPVFGTDSSFQLNLNDEISYAASSPSVTALEENVFAVAWASSPSTRNIAYNQHIKCRLFYWNETMKVPKMAYETITVNKYTNLSQHSPQITALSDHNNQISDSKRFVIVWHSYNLDGNFEAIYQKIYRWDFEQETGANIQVQILYDDESKPESKVNDAANSNIIKLVGKVQVSSIFDLSKYAVSWIGMKKDENSNIYSYDVYAKLFDNYGGESSDQFAVDIPSSFEEQQLSITPLWLSNVERSAYLSLSWSVKDAYTTGLTGIYSKLIYLGDIDPADVPQHVSGELFMDGGVDIYNWNPSNVYTQQIYTNDYPDSTYLMADYMILVWSAMETPQSHSVIHAAIYQTKWNGTEQTKAAFVHVFDEYMTTEAVHEIRAGVNYRAPKVETIGCYNLETDYSDITQSADALINDACDVSICYQYIEVANEDASKTHCSFWRISNMEDGIVMESYYEHEVVVNDVQGTAWSDSCSWNRYYEDISNPMNGKLLVEDQVGDDEHGYGIFGRMVVYKPWSLEGSNVSEVKKNMSTMLAVFLTILVLFIVCLCGSFAYHKYVKSRASVGFSDEIDAVNQQDEKVLNSKPQQFLNKLSQFKIRKKHKHQQLSDVDIDEIDEASIDLGNDDDTKTAYNIAHNNMSNPKPMNQKRDTKAVHVIREESGDDTESGSSDDIGGVGGGGAGNKKDEVIVKDVGDSSDSSNSDQDKENEKNKNENNAQDEEAEDVIHAKLNSDDEDSSDK